MVHTCHGASQKSYVQWGKDVNMMLFVSVARHATINPSQKGRQRRSHLTSASPGRRSHPSQSATKMAHVVLVVTLRAKRGLLALCPLLILNTVRCQTMITIPPCDLSAVHAGSAQHGCGAGSQNCHNRIWCDRHLEGVLVFFGTLLFRCHVFLLRCVFDSY